MLSSNCANVAANRNSYTTVLTERIVHNWTITKFSLLPVGVGKTVRSLWFHSRDKSDNWNLLLYPRGVHDNPSEDIDYVGLFLARDSPDEPQIPVHVELKITKSDKTLKKLSFTHEYGPQYNYGFDEFLERSKLLTTNSSDDDDDELTISCIIDKPAKIVMSVVNLAGINSKESPLSDDFRCLFEDPIFGDFTIIVGDEKFLTHRCILAKRSPVFAAMFKHNNLEENRKKEMKIEYIEPDVVKGMLEFIYTDQVTNLKELASGLLEVADKYDLKKLKIMCEKTLYQGLNQDNAAEVMLLADLHRANQLKKRAMKYILDHTPEVVKSNHWKKIEGNPALLLQLFNQSVLS